MNEEILEQIPLFVLRALGAYRSENGNRKPQFRTIMRKVNIQLSRMGYDFDTFSEELQERIEQIVRVGLEENKKNT